MKNLNFKIENLSRSQVWDQIEIQFSNPIGILIENQIENQIQNQTWRQIGFPIWRSIWNQVK